jgi:deoxyribose-phosphate aldolase
MQSFAYLDVAKMIDHALLSPTLAIDDLHSGIDLALAYDVASVCIMPYYVKQCARRLAGSTVKASTVIGFPHGVNTTETKRIEAQQALADGCEELDMVVNISQVISGQWDDVSQDIAAVIETTHQAGQKVKVIFENCYLNEMQKIRLCEICTDLGADWVKTSTGFGTSGATIEDLILMRKHSGPRVQVKAAGGVKELDALLQIRQIGVSRCGSSRTAEILGEARKRLGMEMVSVKASGPAGY